MDTGSLASSHLVLLGAHLSARLMQDQGRYECTCLAMPLGSHMAVT
jgi:hypothetical protein